MEARIQRWIRIAVVVTLVGATAYYFFLPLRPIDLRPYERSVFSQMGEDGVIEKIFEVIKPTTKYAVEFGAWDGVAASNTRNLIVNKGWGGLQMEGDPVRGAKLQEVYKDYPNVTTRSVWIYPGNIEILFEEADVPRFFDLLIIDIDSNDYYIWKAIHNYRPKVVQIEFNSHFPPPELAVIDFHPMNYWDEKTDYFGASIQSYCNLAKKKGYELIYCNKNGNNLYFVDKKYFRLFGIRDNSPEAMYRPPNYGGLSEGARGPNGKGFPRFEDEYEDLTWENIRIQKKFVER